jgi:PAS domain S-box-containing protein
VGDVLARAVKDRRTVTWTFDIDSYRFLDASDATVELFGYSREELLTKDIYDVVAPEEHDRLRRHLPERGESGDAGQWICARKDGSRFVMNVRFKNVEIGGNIVSFVYADRVREHGPAS